MVWTLRYTLGLCEHNTMQKEQLQHLMSC